MNEIDFNDSKSLTPFLEVYERETDRGCAILAGVLLDALLEKVLRKFMLPSTPNGLFEGYGPLSSFSAKIDLVHYLGLISRGECSELHRIRKIRNEFAHSLDQSLSFENQPISDQVRLLQLRGSTILKDEKFGSLRKEFSVSVALMTGFLMSRFERLKQPTEPSNIIGALQEHNERKGT